MATENWFDKSSVRSSSSGERRRRSWGVLVDSWEDDSSSSSEWVSESGSGVRVLQRRGLSQGGLGGWEMVGVKEALLDSRPSVTRSVQKDSWGLLLLGGRYSRRDRRPPSTVDKGVKREAS